MEQTYDRRSVLRAGAATAGVVLGTGVLTATSATTSATAAEPVFAHGVASGDPLPDAVLLWTRVTPTPDATPGSGAGPVVDVVWEVAADRRSRPSWRPAR
jgi:alkaline phosphatase D